MKRLLVALVALIAAGSLAGSLAGVAAPVSAQAPAAITSSPPAAAASASTPLPFVRTSAEEPGTGWLAGWLFVGALALVGALLTRKHGVAAWRRHWKQATRATDGVTSVSGQSLGAGISVHVVRWRGEDILLGCTAQQVTLLARKPAPPDDGIETS